MEHAYLSEMSLFKPVLLGVLCEAASRGDLGSAGTAVLKVVVLQLSCIGLRPISKSRQSGAE